MWKEDVDEIVVVRLWACGAMDNASDYGSEDSRFESWHARKTYLLAPPPIATP